MIAVNTPRSRARVAASCSASRADLDLVRPGTAGPLRRVGCTCLARRGRPTTVRSSRSRRARRVRCEGRCVRSPARACRAPGRGGPGTQRERARLTASSAWRRAAAASPAAGSIRVRRQTRGTTGRGRSRSDASLPQRPRGRCRIDRGGSAEDQRAVRRRRAKKRRRIARPAGKGLMGSFWPAPIAVDEQRVAREPSQNRTLEPRIGVRGACQEPVGVGHDAGVEPRLWTGAREPRRDAQGGALGVLGHGRVERPRDGAGAGVVGVEHAEPKGRADTHAGEGGRLHLRGPLGVVAGMPASYVVRLASLF